MLAAIDRSVWDFKLKRDFFQIFNRLNAHQRKFNCWFKLVLEGELDLWSDCIPEFSCKHRFVFGKVGLTLVSEFEVPMQSHIDLDVASDALIDHGVCYTLSEIFTFDISDCATRKLAHFR